MMLLISVSLLLATCLESARTTRYEIREHESNLQEEIEVVPGGRRGGGFGGGRSGGGRSGGGLFGGRSNTGGVRSHTAPRGPVANPRPTYNNHGFNNARPSAPGHSTVPRVNTRPGGPVAGTRPGYGGNVRSTPGGPVARPSGYRPGVPPPVVARPVYHPTPYSPTFVHNSGYGGGHMAASFAGGALIGAGGMYMYDRMHGGYRPHGLYSSGFGNPYGHSYTVVHHHHYDGPYYSRQWYSVSNDAYTDLRAPSTGGLRTRHRPVKPKPNSDAVLCIEEGMEKTTMRLHYRMHGSKDKELQTQDIDAINGIVGGLTPPSLGSIKDQMKSGDFSQLIQALNHYVPRMDKKTNLVGIAVNVMIGAVPEYGGNVTVAQMALDKLSWTPPTKAKFLVARVISEAWQAQLELETQWSQGYTGFMSMDQMSGPRLAAAAVGSQSLKVNKKEILKNWQSLGEKSKSDINFDNELSKLKTTTLKLPEPKDPKAPDPKALSMLDVGTESQTSASKLGGYWIAAGEFCDVAEAVGIGCCETGSDASSGTSATRCQLLKKSNATEYLNKAYGEAKASFVANKANPDDLLNIMLTLAAVDEWLDLGAQVVFAKPATATLSDGIAMQLMALNDQPAPKKEPTNELPPTQSSRTRTTVHRSYRSSGGQFTIINFIVLGSLLLCCCCCLWWCCCSSKGSDTDYDQSSFVVQAQPAYYAQPQPQGYVDFTCPPGSGPGCEVDVPMPDGTTRRVVVPDGVYAGMVFSVPV